MAPPPEDPVHPAPPPASEAAPGVTRAGPLRRLYDWVLHWAHTRYGAPALAVVSFCESSFFPIPPDPLLIALGIGRPRRAVWYGVLCTLSSVAGGLLGYWIGAGLFDLFGERILALYGVEEKFTELSADFAEAGFIAVAVAALTPIPYKVFTIAAGAAHLSLPVFIGASLLGRGVRFIAEGWLVGRFGAPIRVFIDRWFPWIAWGLATVGVAGFLAVRLLLDES